MTLLTLEFNSDNSDVTNRRDSFQQRFNMAVEVILRNRVPQFLQNFFLRVTSYIRIHRDGAQLTPTTHSSAFLHVMSTATRRHMTARVRVSSIRRRLNFFKYSSALRLSGRAPAARELHDVITTQQQRSRDKTLSRCRMSWSRCSSSCRCCRSRRPRIAKRSRF